MKDCGHQGPGVRNIALGFRAAEGFDAWLDGSKVRKRHKLKKEREMSTFTKSCLAGGKEQSRAFDKKQI